MMTVEQDQTAGALVISGNVDPSTGDIDSPRDLIIQGQVTDSRRVRSAGDVLVEGSVEAAEIQAGRNLIIRGGAVGRNKCRCTAGGDMTVRHVNGGHLDAGGNLTIQSHVTQARLICGGRLEVLEGSLSGGHVTAAGGLACRDVGTAAGVPTLIEAGINDALRRLASERLPKLETDLAHLERMKTAVAPLVRNQKALTPQEKEKATELLYEIEELEEPFNVSLDKLRHAQERLQAQLKPEIVVHGLLHAGVTIRIGSQEAQVRTTMKGPLSVVGRKIDGRNGIAVVEADTGSWQPLNCVDFHDAILERLHRILTIQN